MPELPDVEIFRRTAETHALNQAIEAVEIDDQKVAASSPQNLSESLRGYWFTEAKRRGKYLLMPTSGETVLVMHFGMTGWLEYNQGDKPGYAKATFNYTNGYSLHFINPRKLGRLYITDDIEAFCQYMKAGPDALALKEDAFMERAQKKKGMIKSALMDQSFISGIGNIYSDEICFQAGFHPKTKINDLSEIQLVRLFHAMNDVLQTAIEHHAIPEKMPAHFIIPRRKEGEYCPRCGGAIKKDKRSGRGFYFCPHCQE